jgi:hypothetical protein
VSGIDVAADGSPRPGSRFVMGRRAMHTAQLLVTIGGFAAIGWVLWYFLVPPGRGPRPPRREAE